MVARRLRRLVMMVSYRGADAAVRWRAVEEQFTTTWNQSNLT
jgi:hypothetical protein